MPVGAEITPTGVHFRVWAPARKKVQVAVESVPGRKSDSFTVELVSEKNGYFSGSVDGIPAGTLYRFKLDNEENLFPDPASRFQPEGPHGPSEIVDPGTFAWTDAGWEGVRLENQIIYEMHIGTYTPEGTWKAALEQLPAIAETGITLLEIMPVAEFPGAFGWGYDGVNLFAPYHFYGRPDDFRRFVDRAHSLGLGVILDIVYNHLGPDGNYLGQFSREYFTDRYVCEWGEAINFDGEHAGPVREYYLANAAYWIREFHLDGFRLDATQQIFDASDDHILAALARSSRAAAAGRKILLIAENEIQDTRLIRPPEEGGFGLDAVWNDDFHHSAVVAMTGKNEAYYTDYRGMPQEFISCAKYGYLYQGQLYFWQKIYRGTPTRGIDAIHFVNYIQNHDQIANSGRGYRVQKLSSPGLFRAFTALMILMPGIPLLFQGQEFAASSPFLFFADHEENLAGLVAKGRAEFLGQFRSLGRPEVQKRLAAPSDEATFRNSKLDLRERTANEESYAMHRDLIRLRKEDPVIRRADVDGAVLSRNSFVLRFFSPRECYPEGDRLLVVNLGRDLPFCPAPEPLIAHPGNCRWAILWSSEDPLYGGTGTPPLQTEEGWFIPARSAILLFPERL
ncbi:MAG: malto-oligosyltrehalose trehalohydrolase [Syntrophales bacterium]|nr:malto-oligosyltrehalose trehalohydrolase [Syntrophales bacterium]